jgi:hypothetical protein
LREADTVEGIVPMIWQLTIVALLVAGAAVYLIRKTWKTWSGSGHGCGGGCGCGKSTSVPEKGRDSITLIPADQLTIRSREP